MGGLAVPSCQSHGVVYASIGFVRFFSSVHVQPRANYRTDKLDHGISFEMAKLVFDDPLAMTRHDPHPDGGRWQTVGLIGEVKTRADTGEEVGRIISARQATTHETRAYEEGDF
jgi:uncharacterized protein